MRKSILTALVLGTSLTFLGCPPPEGGNKGGETTPPAGGETTPPAGGEATPPAGGETTPPAGETPATPTEAPKAQKVDLSHVKAGQKYVYKMEASGMEMQQIYEVAEVTDTTVKCKLHMLMKMPGATEFTAQGDPTPYDWAIPAPTGETTSAQPTTEVKTSREKLSAGGQEWDCMVSESQGSKTWCPMKGDMVTFPPYIKMESAQSKAELVEIK
jgi:hypothetical protein